LRLHANHEIEELLSLDYLGDGLPADGGSDHSLNVSDIDTVASDFVPIDINQQAGLAQLAHHCEIGKAGHLGQNILDLNRLVLKDIQIVAVNLHCQRTLQTGQRLIDCIFRGLGVVEDDAGECTELLVDSRDQFFLVMDLAIPGFVVVGAQTDIELAIEKTGGVGAVVGTT
jgi:hypothetical protein